MPKVLLHTDIDALCLTFTECADYLTTLSRWTRVAGETSCPGGGSLDEGTKIVDAWRTLPAEKRATARQDTVDAIFRSLLISGLGLITDIVMYQALFAKARNGDIQFCIDLLRPCMHQLNGMAFRPLPLEGICTQMYDQVMSPLFVSRNSSVYCEMSEA